jgi:hypothetical protein
VTWTTDPKCGPGCPASEDYKRITVVVTIDGAAHPNEPAIVSTVVADPTAAPAGAPKDSVQSPLDSASTSCQVGTSANGTAILGSCSNGISGTPNDFYLYDTSTLNTSTGADVTTRQPITGDHATHKTIAPVQGLLCTLLGLLLSGCENPNLMGADAPPTSTPVAPIFRYSTDVTGDLYSGGQILKKDVGCSSSPSWSTGTQENRGAFFTTPALASNLTLNGSGGATLYMQSATGVAADVTVCLGVYLAPVSVLGLVNTPPVQLGVLALADVAVPTVPTPVSFNFSGAFGTSGGQASTYTFLAGKRIGIRVWIAASAGDVALLYDHPEFASVVQVNSQ